jgi:hypothetical protein
MPSMKRSDRLGGSRRLALREDPARKVPVDVHADKAVDQSAAGDLDPSQVGRVQLPVGEGFRQRGFGRADQFGIVPGQSGCPIVIEIPASRDDLEMGRVRIAQRR